MDRATTARSQRCSAIAFAPERQRIVARADAILSVGQLAGGKALNRMEYTTIHGQPVRPQHVPERPISRKRPEWILAARSIPDLIRFGELVHFDWRLTSSEAHKCEAHKWVRLDLSLPNVGLAYVFRQEWQYRKRVHDRR